MNRKPGYLYAPLEDLDSIRLLMVENVGSTSKGRGPIRCWIRHFNLSNAPPYRALSYARGSADTKKIFLNDRIVEVRRNLWEALAHIQFASFDFRAAGQDQIFAEEDSKWVWIDALCIDQNNTMERNHQVGIMSKIYRKASEVLVWLGCESDFRNGPQISAAIEALTLMRDDKKGPDPSQILDQNHEGLLALFQLPYWSRLWIVQEIGLAIKITLLFDKMSTSWHNLHKLRKLLSSPYFPNAHGLLPGSTFTSTHKAELLNAQAFKLDRQRYDTHPNNLEHLIESFQDSLCNDARDKVYGLLGLADDCQGGQIDVNYFKSLFEVYTDVINFYYKTRRRAGPSQHTPRFSQIVQKSFRNHSTSPGSTKQTMDFSLSPYASVLRPSLHIFGIKCGTITQFGDAIDLAELSRFQPVAPDLTTHVRSTISNAVRDLKKLVPLRARTSFAVQAKNATPTLIAQNMEREWAGGDPFLEPQDRSLQFWLNNGRTGYAPYNALLGDTIIQFLGCDVAAVLRPSPAPNNQNGQVYDIIGKALVAKSGKEIRDAEPWARRYEYGVPDYGVSFGWRAEDAWYLWVDWGTLWALTQ